MNRRCTHRWTRRLRFLPSKARSWDVGGGHLLLKTPRGQHKPVLAQLHFSCPSPLMIRAQLSITMIPGVQQSREFQMSELAITRTIRTLNSDLVYGCANESRVFISSIFVYSPRFVSHYWSWCMNVGRLRVGNWTVEQIPRLG